MKRSLTIPLLIVTLLIGGLHYAQAVVNEVTGRSAYIGNGSTTSFTYTFKILSKTDIEVLLNGVVRTVDVDYIVSGLGVDAGGAVVFAVAPATGVNVTLLRKQPVRQISVYQPNEGFPAKRLEGDLDKQAMINQQQTEAINRAIKLKKQSTESGKTFDDLAGNAGKFARVKTDASGFDYASVTSSGSLTLPVAIGDGGTGGTTAASARTNLDVPSNAEAILDTIVTTKGDLITATAGSTPARKAAGANNKYLMADSSQADGLLYSDVDRVKESGGQVLTLGAVADGQILKRSGTTIVSQLPPTFTSEFISSNQTVTFSTVLNVAHGLGVVPKLVQVVYKCTTTEHGYAVNDEIPIYSGTVDGSFINGSTWVAWDATNVIITTTTRALMPHKTSGGRIDLTAASWRFVVKAWK
jgi:hypothetical protein